MSFSEHPFLIHMKTLLVPIHPAGYSLVAGGLAVSFLLAMMSSFWGTLGLVATALIAFFFRNPERVVPIASGLIVAPADGLIYAMEDVVPPAALDLGSTPLKRISIVQKLTDVHVNRLPASGKIIASTYAPGIFADATRRQAPEENERHLVTMATDEGPSIGIVQIASVVARLIACDVTPDQHVKRGEHLGISGSRVDIYLPQNTEINVFDGQRTIAGETVIAQFVVV